MARSGVLDFSHCAAYQSASIKCFIRAMGLFAGPCSRATRKKSLRQPTTAASARGVGPDEAYPEGVGILPLAEAGPHHFSTTEALNEALVRNLTWRFRAAEARERERIQQELLPEATPELDGWRIAAYYEPAREVGGDFYDFLEFPDGRLGLVVGDATGHGMPAALVMATTRGMLRAVVQSLESPGEVLARVNEALVA